MFHRFPCSFEYFPVDGMQDGNNIQGRFYYHPLSYQQVIGPDHQPDAQKTKIFQSIQKICGRYSNLLARLAKEPNEKKN